MDDYHYKRMVASGIVYFLTGAAVIYLLPVWVPVLLSVLCIVAVGFIGYAIWLFIGFICEEYNKDDK